MVDIRLRGGIRWLPDEGSCFEVLGPLSDDQQADRPYLMLNPCTNRTSSVAYICYIQLLVKTVRLVQNY